MRMPTPDDRELSILHALLVFYAAWLIGCVVFGLPTAGVIWLVWQVLRG